MANGTPDKPEKAKQNPQSETERELDRYERLQAASERQIEKLGTSYETHSNLIKTALYLIAAGGALLATIGTFFFYSSIHEMENRAQLTVQDQIQALTNTVASQIADETNRIDTAINEKFNRENIEPLIETKIQAKVDQVTAKIIQEEIHQQIDPEFAALTNKISDVEAALDQAKISSHDVRNVLDLAMNIVMALNDDRGAFDTLYAEGLSGTNRYQRAISEVIANITMQNIQPDSPFEKKALNWQIVNFNPDTNSFDDYIQLMNKLGEPSAVSIVLQTLSEQTRFSEYRKLSLYRDLIKNTQSIKILSTICKLLNNQNHFNYTILGEPQYLDWLNSQIPQQTIIDCTASIKTNKNNVESYMFRAQAYLALTNYSDALNDYEKAISIEPTNIFALNGCAWLLAVCPKDSIRNGNKAVSFATKACQLDNWKDWHCVGTLAAACAEAGNFSQAIKYENLAIRMEGIGQSDIDAEKHRLTLFEKDLPTHEMP